MCSLCQSVTLNLSGKEKKLKRRSLRVPRERLGLGRGKKKKKGERRNKGREKEKKITTA